MEPEDQNATTKTLYLQASEPAISPFTGAIVHWIPPAITREAYARHYPECVAAVVVRTFDDGSVSLRPVLPPECSQPLAEDTARCAHDQERTPGTWHWTRFALAAVFGPRQCASGCPR